MRIDEIMVDDWFYFQTYEVIDDNMIDTCEALQVLTIDAYDAFDNYPIVVSFENVTNKPEQLQPIPLTNKILEDNFTYDTKLEIYKCEHFIMDICDDGVMIGQIGIGFHGEEFQYFMTIKYVHELQHLLKLFNSTKEIKL